MVKDQIQESKVKRSGCSAGRPLIWCVYTIQLVPTCQSEHSRRGGFRTEEVDEGMTSNSNSFPSLVPHLHPTTERQSSHWLIDLDDRGTASYSFGVARASLASGTAGADRQACGLKISVRTRIPQRSSCARYRSSQMACRAVETSSEPSASQRQRVPIA